MITKRNDKEGREFWRHAEEARRKVESWPEWKQRVRVTQISNNWLNGILNDAAKEVSTWPVWMRKGDVRAR